MDLGTIWEISLSAVLMISFVILVRFIFKRRMPKKMIVWLWCLVLVRLLTPTAFFVTVAKIGVQTSGTADTDTVAQTSEAANTDAVSQTSEATDTDTVSQTSEAMDTDTAVQMSKTADTDTAEDAEPAWQRRSAENLLTGNPYLASFTGTVTISQYDDYIFSTLEGNLSDASSLSAGTAAAASFIEAEKANAPAGAVISADAIIAPAFPFFPAAILPAAPVISAVWLGGMLVLTVFFGGAYLWGGRRYRDALPVSHPNLTEWLTLPKRRRTVTVKQSDRIASPLVYGLFRPVILLPKWMDWDDREQLFFVLTHEWVHLRNLDLWKKLVMLAAAVLHWFNPLVWVMLWLFNRDLELSCDERVVSLHGLTARAEYARALIGMAEKRRLSVPLYAYFSRNILEQRIKAIMEYRCHSGFSVGIFIAAAVCFVGAEILGLAAVQTHSTAIHLSYTASAENASVEATAKAAAETLTEDTAGVNQPPPRKQTYKIEVVKGQIQSAELLSDQTAMDEGV